jgi:hypothetical protein
MEYEKKASEQLPPRILPDRRGSGGKTPWAQSVVPTTFCETPPVECIVVVVVYGYGYINSSCDYYYYYYYWCSL